MRVVRYLSRLAQQGSSRVGFFVERWKKLGRHNCLSGETELSNAMVGGMTSKSSAGSFRF